MSEHLVPGLIMAGLLERDGRHRLSGPEQVRPGQPRDPHTHPPTPPKALRPFSKHLEARTHHLQTPHRPKKRPNPRPGPPPLPSPANPPNSPYKLQKKQPHNVKSLKMASIRLHPRLHPRLSPLLLHRRTHPQVEDLVPKQHCKLSLFESL